VHVPHSRPLRGTCSPVPGKLVRGTPLHGVRHPAEAFPVRVRGHHVKVRVRLSQVLALFGLRHCTTWVTVNQAGPVLSICVRGIGTYQGPAHQSGGAGCSPQDQARLDGPRGGYRDTPEAVSESLHHSEQHHRELPATVHADHGWSHAWRLGSRLEQRCQCRAASSYALGHSSQDSPRAW
jgi:hypothetical protein